MDDDNDNEEIRTAYMLNRKQRRRLVVKPQNHCVLSMKAYMIQINESRGYDVEVVWEDSSGCYYNLIKRKKNS